MRRLCFVATLLLAGCATNPAGTYEGTAPAASGGAERQVAVTLDADGTATVSTAFSGQPSRSLVKGKWRRAGTDDVIVTMEEAPRYEEIAFKQQGDRLVPTWWERPTWGSEGPGTLTRVKSEK